MINTITNLAVRLVICIAVYIITKYIVPYFKEKLTSACALKVVKAVKQIVNADNKGEAKLALASEKLAEMLSRLGISISQDQLRIYIEDAYLTMKKELE
jgi:uncharacterized protein (UPF0305 family)